MAEEYDTADPLSQPVGANPVPPRPSTIHNIFIGPNGIRAGWRLLIFFLLVVAIVAAMVKVPAVKDFLRTHPPGEFTAIGLIGTEFLLQLFPVLLAASIMTFIEKRTFADYGIPLDQAFGKLFWQGLPMGFAMLSLLLLLIAAFHGFSLGAIALSGTEALKYGSLYFLGFILVGIFEEFAFRGYLQSTLGSGIGFWWAAVALSCLFGYVHRGNPGEAKFGLIMAGSFGLLAAFALKRTGNIWFPIGMHASWDWGETFLYGTPDSGITAQGHFFNSSFHGKPWLTGGSVGPEGSWLVFVVLIVWALAIHFLFPAKPTSIARSKTGGEVEFHDGRAESS